MGIALLSFLTSSLSLPLFSPLYPPKSNDIWRYFDVTPLLRPTGGTKAATDVFCGEMLLPLRQAGTSVLFDLRPPTALRTSLYVSSWSSHFWGPLRNLQEYFLDETPPARPLARLLPTCLRPSPIQPPPLGSDTLPCWARWKAAFAAGREGRRRDGRRHALTGRGWARGRSRRLKAERRPRINWLCLRHFPEE